ncbi:MAG TPA: hypothetical protein VIT42_08330, partial [Microlunatus sp.]
AVALLRDDRLSERLGRVEFFPDEPDPPDDRTPLTLPLGCVRGMTNSCGSGPTNRRFAFDAWH